MREHEINVVARAVKAMGDNSRGSVMLYQIVRDAEKEAEESGNKDGKCDTGENDYCVVVNVSRFSSLQRALKWGGLKPVSN